MAIEHIPPARHGQARAFYERVGRRFAIAPDDAVIAAFDGGTIIGVVRLCTEHGEVVLRGMEVAPERQRQGIGRALLAACCAALGERACWCLPFEHLEAFYAAAGFGRVADREVPEWLGKRLTGYRADGDRAICMRRPVAPR